MRSVSDELDEKMGWTGQKKEQSALRGLIHGVYHRCVGVAKKMAGNEEGAKAEFNRAGQQFDKAKRNLFE